MWLAKVLNSLSSQAWAFTLVLLGIAGFGISCVCHVQDVRTTVMNASTGLVAAGVAMFQHQSKDANGGTPTSTGQVTLDGDTAKATLSTPAA